MGVTVLSKALDIVRLIGIATHPAPGVGGGERVIGVIAG
jgi:hypothetical protein